MPQLEIAVARPQRWDAPFGEAMRDADVDQLLQIEPFSSIDPQRFPPSIPLRDILRNDCRVSEYHDGEIVVREGDYGHSAFLVLQGKVRVVLEGLTPEALGRPPTTKRRVSEVLLSLFRSPRIPEVRHEIGATPAAAAPLRRVFLQDVPRILESGRTLTLHTGEIFGELAALTRTPRSATVLAEGEVLLLEIRWQGLRDMMRRTPALAQHIERLYRENSLRVHLRETPLFAQLPDSQLAAVAEATVFETHGDFEWQAQFEQEKTEKPADAVVHEPLIEEEGATTGGLLLVRSGFARLSHRFGHGHRTIAYLGKGQVFGLGEAVATFQAGQPQPRTNSLRALGYVDVLRIPQSVLDSQVFPHLSAEALAAAGAKHAMYCTKHHCDPQAGKIGGEQDKVDAPLLEFLVEQRLINGRQAMLVNLDRCTRCDDCVRACAAAHDNNPRFLRHGAHHGSFMVAHACMHCVDPVCMIGCPTGAIARESSNGVVRINDLTCIGCGTCAKSCPYDNIRMTEIRDPSGALVLDRESQQPIQKATKCDLCADLPGGPACQRACPHDALVRIDLGNLGELSAWANR